MSRKFMFDTLGWGFILWLTGYLLGIALFFVVPPNLLGWLIMPVGVGITLWVLMKRIRAKSVVYYLYLSVIWMVIAMVCDYFFLVKLFKPEDGYYKLDVYLYYFLTFFLPLFAYWWKCRRHVFS